MTFAPGLRLTKTHIKFGLSAMALASLIACGGSDDNNNDPEPARPQDSRTFTPVSETTFDALAGTAVETDRWTGVLNGAAYRVEVPKTGWNGKLVMWAHGYAGTGPDLTVGTPIMRRYLLDQATPGPLRATRRTTTTCARASKTRRLGTQLRSDRRRQGPHIGHAEQDLHQRHIDGRAHHAAAIEAEAESTAINKVHYSGAVPMCGVVGDVNLFNYFAGYQVAAQQLAGVPLTMFPSPDFATVGPIVQAALWTTFPTVSNAEGDKLKNVIMNLSGGARPFYAEGWADPSHQTNIWSSLGGDGTISGILNENILDTTGLFYKVDASSPDVTPVDTAFNAAAFKISPTPDANRLRRDGLRWIPVANGEIGVPVVTIHTLGDLFVPFRMEQVYHDRVAAKGNSQWLVQRVIRDVGHCAFTAAEATSAFDAW